MKTLIIRFIILLGVILNLTSCNILFGKKIPMDSEDAIQTIKETIKNNAEVGTGRIHSISWHEDCVQELKNYLGFIRISWATEDNSNYTQEFQKNEKGEFIAEEPKKERFTTVCYEFVKPFDIDKLDVTAILKQINEGKSLLGDEYEYASVGSYSIDQNTLDMRVKNMKKCNPEEYGIQRIIFSLNAYKKGEDSKREGRRVITNYYTVSFIVNEDGSVQASKR